MLVAAGQFPYPYRPGMEIDLTGPQTDGKAFRLPGVMSLSWVPSFGNSSESTDPASIAGKEFYGKVRAAYSGALDADAPDFMVYVGGLDSIFTYIGWLKRLYRMISTYAPDNLDLPEALIAATGFKSIADQKDMRANKTRFWQGINELILMSRKFKCPAVMDLFNRHYWMSDNVYADAPSTRAQLYVFNLEAVYMTKQVMEASTGTEPVQGLQLTPIPKQKKSGDASIVDTLLNFGLSLIQAFDTWDSAYTISGYLQRAFEGTPSFVVAELLQDELITPSYVPEVLLQIENARCVWLQDVCSSNVAGVDSQLKAMCDAAIVTQNTITNAVVSNVDFTYSENNSRNSLAFAIYGWMPDTVAPAFNIRSEMPTVADSVIASRLHAHVDVLATNTATNTYAFKYHIVAGTEILLGMAVMKKSGSASWTAEKVQQLVADSMVTKGSGEATRFTQAPVATIEQFDSHPVVYSANMTGGTNDPNIIVYPHTDVFNLTKITVEMLQNLHKICFYSELNSFSI